MKALTLKDSPRLYVDPDTARNLSDKLHSPFLQDLADQVLEDAGRLVYTSTIKEGQCTTYQHGTRRINSRLQCLTCAWTLTGESRYRKAAIRHLAGLLEWNHISCEANSTIPPEVDLSFCLSYGELSATVGLMYDLFRPEITAPEKEVFFAVLDRFLMKAAVKCVSNPPWWANKVWSNWNGVCAGGMGIMALAFYKDLPDAKTLIPFVEGSLGEYFKSYIDNGGGCHEGTGYWNYGMNYAMRYVLSWESATGKKHKALKIKEIGKSLFFPLDFTGISFGDNDGWGPTAFYFLLARRLGMQQAALNAATYLLAGKKHHRKKRPKRVNGGDLLYAADAIPTAAEIKKLKTAHEKKRVPVARVYDGLDWAALADDEAFPKLRLALRGGSSKIAGHGMLDLLSFRCRVNGELMITDQQDGGYMATTFSRRGHETYGRSAASKSTIFVDGLACHADSECDLTEVIKKQDLLGIRIDASHIILPRWKQVFIGRLVLMVEKAYWLVVDHVITAKPAGKHWLESRFHTFAKTHQRKDAVALRSGREHLQMSFASLDKAVMQESQGLPSQPLPQTTLFRWMSTAARPDQFHVAALNPGRRKLRLSVHKEKRSGYAIEIAGGQDYQRTIRLTSDLKLKP